MRDDTNPAPRDPAFVRSAGDVPAEGVVFDVTPGDPDPAALAYAVARVDREARTVTLAPHEMTDAEAVRARRTLIGCWPGCRCDMDRDCPGYNEED